MKTKIIDCLKKKVLLVDGLPDGILDLRITDQVKVADGKGDRLTIGWKTREKRLDETVENWLSEAVSTYQVLGLKGNWEYLHKLSEVTEEQCKELVDYFTIDDEFWSTGVFRGYKEDTHYHTAKESFMSALEANNVMFESVDMPNPNDFGYYEDYDDEGHLNSSGWGSEQSEDTYHDAIDFWLLDEANVFNPNQTLIFTEQ